MVGSGARVCGRWTSSPGTRECPMRWRIRRRSVRTRCTRGCSAAMLSTSCTRRFRRSGSRITFTSLRREMVVSLGTPSTRSTRRSGSGSSSRASSVLTRTAVSSCMASRGERRACMLGGRLGGSRRLLPRRRSSRVRWSALRSPLRACRTRKRAVGSGASAMTSSGPTHPRWGSRGRSSASLLAGGRSRVGALGLPCRGRTLACSRRSIRRTLTSRWSCPRSRSTRRSSGC